jgi:hypothetical protein
METKKEYLNRIFNLARMRGLCRTQGDFARLLGMNQGTISKALKGEEGFCTDSICRRVKIWAAGQGLEQMAESVASPKPQRPDIVIPAETADLYNNMSETIRIQAELIARLQGVGARGLGVFGVAEKNAANLDLGK